jgi:hypothetical protein
MNTRSIFAKITTLGLLAVPMVVSAQGLFGENEDLADSGESILTFINSYLVPLIFALALLFFLWGVLKAFVIKGDEDSRSEGKQYMVWAIVGLVVMVSLWGIVNLLSGALGLDEETITDIPASPTTND